MESTDTGKRGLALTSQRLSDPDPGRADARTHAATALAVVFWLATCTAQVIAPALPGWKSGIGNWITRWEAASALLSQLALVGGCTFAFWLLMVVLREHRVGIGFRIGAAPLAAAVITTAIAASTQHLAALLSLGLSLMVGFLALSSAWTTARHAHTRGLGLALGLVGLGAGFATMSRLLALRASAEALTSLFAVSRVLATITHLLGIAAFVIGALWIGHKRRTQGLLIIVVPMILGLLVAATAHFGALASGDSVMILVSRLSFELGRHPYPMLPEFLRQSGDVMLLLASAAVLFGDGRGKMGRAALSLALLPRGGTDVPILALALALASLLAPLCAARPAAPPALNTSDEKPGSTPLGVPSDN